MRIALTGASGFIGKRVVAALLDRGHQLHVAGRRRPQPGVAFSPWDAAQPFPEEAVKEAQAVIHLAGETVAQRWTDSAKFISGPLKRTRSAAIS